MITQKAIKRLPAWPPAVYILMILIATFALTAENYFVLDNLTNILIQAAPLLILACGQTLIVLLQGTDLSIGASMSLVTVLWIYLLKGGMTMPAAIALSIAAAIVSGFLTGLFVSFLKLPPFIATLGMQNILRSIALVLSKGSSIYFKDPIFSNIANKGALGLSWSVWIAAACFLLTYIMLFRTRFGMRIFTLGGNSEALTLSGASPRWSTVQAFTYCGLMAGVAGFILTCRVESGNPNVGNGWEFNSVAAVLLGGTSMREGRGSVSGTVFGVLLIQVLKSGLIQVGVKSIYQNALIGIVVLSAIIFDAMIKRRQEER